MKKIFQFSIFVILCTLSIGCFIKKYPLRYTICQTNKNLPYPKDKIEIILLNDSLGVFKNYLQFDKVFVQNFNYEKIQNSFLCLRNIDSVNLNIISLKEKDTIICYKRKMLFFYNGKTKYLLSFRKKFF